ncbi:hypothetical protein [Bradyrhizobium sp. Tv2a-2]|uniref:hypothetical protein n=1 Tax=Bradyrhizobium sp. Tv2a-2 TaxID=113395 RepID=UPI0004049CB2|nr:hypothetical protein [Bradyrhizobium sp. Tv2a-2]
MSTNWRISSFNGALLACYFIPTWAIIAFRIVEAPVRGLFERPNVSAAFYLGDQLQWGAAGLIRVAWFIALGRLMVVAFFALFLVLLCRPKIRIAGGANEALSIALGLGSLISFALMLMASRVGETEALRLHATELLMMLGTGIIMLVLPPASAPAAVDVPAEPLPLQEPQLLNNG